MKLRPIFLAILVVMQPLLSACSKKENLNLCPDLGEIGHGSAEWEDTKRCVRVMSARYSASRSDAVEISTAAINFCSERKIEPLVKSDSLEMSAKLRDFFERDLREIGIRTVVEMRTADCLAKPGIFDHINDPIPAENAQIKR